MDCQKAEMTMQNYIDGNLTDEVCQEFLTHVHECNHCMEELETYFTIDYALRYMDDPNASDDRFDFKKGLQEDLEMVRQGLTTRKTVKTMQTIFLWIAELLLAFVLLCVLFPEIGSFFESLFRSLFVI